MTRRPIRSLLAALVAGLVLAPAALAATVTVGPGVNGSSRELLSGDTLVVRLPGNPTTGYRWAVTTTSSALRPAGSSYAVPPKGRLGQGGTYVFRFSARAGAGTLRLAYARPWEKGKPPLRTFRLAVLVRVFLFAFERRRPVHTASARSHRCCCCSGAKTTHRPRSGRKCGLQPPLSQVKTFGEAALGRPSLRRPDTTGFGVSKEEER